MKMTLPSLTQLPRWVPLSIMNGGGPANTLVRSLDSGWGRTLFSNIIVRSVGQALYKVRRLTTGQMSCCKVKIAHARLLWRPTKQPAGQHPSTAPPLPFQDKATLDRQCRQNIPELKTANDLEYGFKIRWTCHTRPV